MNPPTDSGALMKGGHASRFALARLLAGDLTDAERAGLEAHLGNCPGCSRVWREAQAAASAFAEKFPTRQYLESVQRTRKGRGPEPRSAGAGSLWARLLGTVQAAGALRSALAAVIVLAAAGALVWLQPAGPGKDLTAKGGASFHLVAKRAAGQMEARGDTVEVAAGDTLQLGLVSASPVHYAVLYRDDGGEILSYLASGGDGHPPLGSPKGENLPNSLVLEGSWSREELFALWSAEPFTFEEARARAAGRPGLGTAAPRGDIQVRTWTLIQGRR